VEWKRGVCQKQQRSQCTKTFGWRGRFQSKKGSPPNYYIGNFHKLRSSLKKMAREHNGNHVASIPSENIEEANVESDLAPTRFTGRRNDAG